MSVRGRGSLPKLRGGLPMLLTALRRVGRHGRTDHRGEFALVQVRGPGLSCLRPRFKVPLPTLIRGQWSRP
jgi:hypothetical protein